MVPAHEARLWHIAQLIGGANLRYRHHGLAMRWPCYNLIVMDLPHIGIIWMNQGCSRDIDSRQNSLGTWDRWIIVDRIDRHCDFNCPLHCVLSVVSHSHDKGVATVKIRVRHIRGNTFIIYYNPAVTWLHRHEDMLIHIEIICHDLSHTYGIFINYNWVRTGIWRIINRIDRY